MNSASLCSLAGRYDNPIDSLKIPALAGQYDNPIPTRFLAPLDLFGLVGSVTFGNITVIIVYAFHIQKWSNSSVPVHISLEKLTKG